MGDWFSALSGFEQTAYLLAILGTVFFLLKLILQTVGIGGDGSDGVDIDGDGVPDIIPDADIADGDADAVDTLHLFTIHGFALMLAIGGWSTILFYEMFGTAFLAAPLGLACGIGALFAHAYLLRATMRLQDDGTVKKRKAIGKEGTVYLRIPKKGDGEGKINFKINSQIREMPAVSRLDTTIEYGAKVIIVGLTKNGVFVVEPAPQRALEDKRDEEDY